MGARAQHSAIDALLRVLDPFAHSLSQIARNMQKGSTPPRPGMLTHDIEGAFINTHPSLLDDVLRMRTMLTYLRNWVRAFNQDRRLGFGLDGCSDDDVNIVVSCPRLDDMVRTLQGTSSYPSPPASQNSF
jgi:hypothetical protein